jgi:tRNA A-37 threonylcarbamoyl transferase component Bud32
MQSASQITQSDWQQTAEALAAGQAASGWQSLAGSAQARVFYHRDHRVYLKLFFEPRPRNRLKIFLFPALARHRKFVRNSQRLRVQGFTAPVVLACGEVADASRAGYVVTEAFEGMGAGSFVSQYLASSTEDPRVRRWKRKVMAALGAEVAKLHNAGIAHGDLRPDNILLSCTSPEPEFCFIDNERNQHHRWRLPLRALIKNLTQLNMIWSEDLSASYRLRFVKAYLQTINRRLPEKRLIRRVHRITQRRLRGKARGGYLQSDRRQMVQPDLSKLLSES